MKKEHRLEITLCGRVVADFTDERDMMETAAARITEWDAMAKRHAEQSVQLALAIGAVLQAVKAKVPHGTFLLWVSQNCGGLSQRTAQKYMLLAATAARRQELEESAGGASTDEERKELAIATTDAERHYERSLSQLYLDWGIVRRPEGWGGARPNSGRPPRDAAKEVEEAAKDPDLSWAEAAGWLKGLREFGIEGDGFGSLADDDLETVVAMLAELSRRAGDILAARKDWKGRGAPVDEVVEVLERGL